MRLDQRIKDAHAESRLFTSRIIFAVIVAVIGCGLLVARLVQLQVTQHQQYRELSVGNSLRLEPVAPTRGLIYDRHDRILAENIPAWQLELIPERVPNLEQTLLALTAAELIAEDRLPELRDKISRSASYSPVVLRTKLSEEDVARFATRRPYLPGVDVSARLIRHYPYGEVGVHAVGYVGGASAADLEQIASAENYAATRYFGKTGAERSFETLLHGQVGHQQRLTNARGRSLEVIPGVSAEPGAAIRLTIDIELQRVAEEALAGHRGALVAVDPRNGEVLALASLPVFDPNGFAVGLGTAEYAALRDDLNRPLFNRAVRGQYPPGSTVKPLLGIAALEAHVSTLEHRLQCQGAYSLPGSSHRYRDWKPEGHGLVDLHDAIAESCDVYFYDLAPKLGIDAIHEYLTRFGLGTATGIDIPGEKPGLVPSREWKRQHFSRREDKPWFPGETVIASIGQGYMLATPLQLAQITAALATRGERYRPRILQSVIAANGVEQPATPERMESVVLDSPSNWEAVANAMYDVLNHPEGTAFAAGRQSLHPAAGKSGTAQVFTVAQEDEYDEEELDYRLRDHALFVAFAPVTNPEIAVAVIVENGSSGSRIAAPIARDVIDTWLTSNANKTLLSRGH